MGNIISDSRPPYKRPFALSAIRSAAKQRKQVRIPLAVLLGLVLSIGCWNTRVARAATVDLCGLVNDFEDPDCGLGFGAQDPWTPTMPNLNYSFDAPECNPNGPACPNAMPPMDSVGNFVGVLNPDDDDVSGKLTHRAIPGPWPAGTCFAVTINAKCDYCVSPSPPRATKCSVKVQVKGWTAGSIPIVNPNTDNWSRRELFTCTQSVFPSGGGDPGDVSPMVLCCPNTGGKDIAFITWSISGVNQRHGTYVTVDCKLP
jgi:hypothetical protein